VPAGIVTFAMFCELLGVVSFSVTAQVVLAAMVVGPARAAALLRLPCVASAVTFRS